MKKSFALLSIILNAALSYALVITGRVYELPYMKPSQHVVVHISNVPGHVTTTDKHGYFILKISDQLPDKIDIEIHSVYRIGIQIKNIYIRNLDTLQLDKVIIFKPDRKVLPKYVTGGSLATAINKKHKIPKTQNLLINRKQYEITLNLDDERYELDLNANF